MTKYETMDPRVLTIHDGVFKFAFLLGLLFTGLGAAWTWDVSNGLARWFLGVPLTAVGLFFVVSTFVVLRWRRGYANWADARGESD